MIPVGSECCNTLLATVPRMIVLLLLKPKTYLNYITLDFIKLTAAPDIVERERERGANLWNSTKQTINQSNQYSSHPIGTPLDIRSVEDLVPASKSVVICVWPATRCKFVNAYFKFFLRKMT